MMKFLDSLPKGLLLLVGLLLVGIIGIIDRITGDYSMLIFYSIPIFLVSWFADRGRGIVICMVAGCARFLSDIPLHNFSLINYWNSVVDIIFFIIISLLVSQLRKALE